VHIAVVATDSHKALTAPLLFVQLYLAAKRIANELPVMASHVVVRHALWSRPLISGCSSYFLWLQAVLPPLGLSSSHQLKQNSRGASALLTVFRQHNRWRARAHNRYKFVTVSLLKRLRDGRFAFGTAV
jgi:hypothetical protein